MRVAGTPDRESALELDTKGSWVFSQFFRVLGTGDRLFVHRRENPLPAARAEADVFEGRLIRFDELPFADAIRAYFAKHVTATHFFAPDAALKALAGRARRARRCRSSIAAATRCRSPPTRRWRSRSSSPTRCRSGCRASRFPTEVEARDGDRVARRRGDRWRRAS